MKMFRLLRADEIECRVSRVTEKGAVLLLYKTARTDADLLDETVGCENWENQFQLVDGVLYGGIGIRFPETGMVWKWDAGTESQTEAEKGRASDAFKRAGFKWGLGRELYSAPFVFIPAAACSIKERDGRYACYDDFYVQDIAYDAGERICYLRIALKDKVVFEWGDVQKPSSEPQALICADCGRPIRDSKKRDGSVWPASAIAAYTHAFAGRDLCVDCGKVEKARQEEVPRR